MSAALLDRRHGHHEQAHDWFAEPGGAPPLVEATQLLEAGQLSDTYLGLAEFCLRAFRRAKGESLGPHGQAVVTTVLLLEAD